MRIYTLGLDKPLVEELEVQFDGPGVKTLDADSDSVEQMLHQETSIPVCVLDPAEVDKGLMDHLLSLRKQVLSLRLVAISSNSDPGLLGRMVSLGIDSFIPRGLSLDRIVERLETKLVQFDSSLERNRRRHVRIMPSDDDRAVFQFRLADGDEQLSGRIINISLGGALLEPNRDPEPLGLEPGQNHLGLKVDLMGREGETGFEAIFVGKGQIGARFHDQAEGFSPMIYHYIRAHMNEVSE